MKISFNFFLKLELEKTIEKPNKAFLKLASRLQVGGNRQFSKGIIHVISNDPLLKEWHVLFCKFLLNSMSNYKKNIVVFLPLSTVFLQIFYRYLPFFYRFSTGSLTFLHHFFTVYLSFLLRFSTVFLFFFYRSPTVSLSLFSRSQTSVRKSLIETWIKNK